MTALRLGVAGYGNMGGRIVRACLAYDPADLVLAGVWDPFPGQMGRLAADSTAARPIDSYEDLLDISDIVHIASPPRHHIEQMLLAHRAGVAILCEKPLAVDLSEARRAVMLLNAAGARAAVNFPFPATLAVDQLEGWLADGSIGTPQRIELDIAFANWPRPQQMQAAWLNGREQGGFIREVVSHFVFLAMRLFGPVSIEFAHATLPTEGSETALYAELSANRLPFTIDARVGGTEHPDYHTFTIIGSSGRIRLTGWAVAQRQLPSGEWQEAPDTLTNEQNRPRMLARTLSEALKMAHGEPHRLATLSEALAVMEIVEALRA